MILVTYTSLNEGNKVQVGTVEELLPCLSFHDCDEWVWHNAPNKESAIARHHEAMLAKKNAGNLDDFTFIHPANESEDGDVH